MNDSPPTVPTSENCTTWIADTIVPPNSTSSGFYKRECTSFVAWRMINDNLMTGFRNTMTRVVNGASVTRTLGDADNWDDAAGALGFAVNSTPAVGAVAHFESGHVAWVKEVSGGNVVIEEYNWGWTHNYNTRTIAATDVSNFIHFQDMAPGSSSGSAYRSDVDSAGKSDLVLTTNEPTGGSKASVLLNNSAFSAPSSWWSDSTAGWSGITPLVGNVAGDNKADYVFAANDNNTGIKIYVAASSGNGFSVPGLWVNLPGWSYTNSKFNLGDIDNNGKADLVITTIPTGGGTAAYVLMNGAGGFSTPSAWWSDSGVGWSGMTPMLGDVTNDGRADYVFAANDNNAGIKVYVAATNAQATGFGTPSLWSNLVGWSYTYSKIRLGHLDDNGKADLIITTIPAGGGSAAYVMLNTTGFGSPAAWWSDSTVGWSGITPFIADVAGDSKSDYAFLANAGTGSRLYVAATNSQGSGFGTPGLWWDGIGWGYSGIKASLS
jgi:surface antigen